MLSRRAGDDVKRPERQDAKYLTRPPSVSHPTLIAPRLSFLQLGALMYVTAHSSGSNYEPADASVSRQFSSSCRGLNAAAGPLRERGTCRVSINVCRRSEVGAVQSQVGHREERSWNHSSSAGCSRSPAPSGPPSATPASSTATSTTARR